MNIKFYAAGTKKTGTFPLFRIDVYALKCNVNVPAGSHKKKKQSHASVSIFVMVVVTVSGELRLTEEQHLALKLDTEVF